MQEPDTTEAILASAAQAFADKGFDGARVDEIARQAKVNKATLYYRIGDKAALYAAVLERVLGQTADQVSRDVDAAAGAEAKLRAYILAIAHHAGSTGHFAPIMLREVASGGRNLPEVAIRHMGRILQALRGILESDEGRRLFRQANPMVTHMMVIGSLMFYAAGGPIRRRVSHEPPPEIDPAHFVPDNAMGAEVAELILAALRQPHTS